MKKKIAKISLLPAIGAIFFLSFSTKEDTAFMAATVNLPDAYTVKLEDEIIHQQDEDVFYPVLKKGYLGFKEAIGFKESRGDYEVINQFGYLGKYQFGKGTLALIGIHNTQEFMNNPALQEAAFYANASRNKWILRKDIERYSGKTMAGVKITESGILAAAHLAGPGSVKKFLRSGGAQGFSDAFGTSIKYYLNKFKDYDTSFVKPNRKAKAKVKKGALGKFA
ncbi:peptidoglycan-binding protein LysM [Mesonia sp. K7]|uniref:peptidoglycan-binding protein LysM n=1 Tax=Mesonia sp. K7 TaxID=2218606 RepID=UPI000DA9615A|nr:peptidoglycan-binding protein LysM [Mesonia sp. K7]PZD79584.1 peptidoglycan-binding protein LysM [Mesonia sp. K7]